MIRIWQSFSCNNSSASRLIARFADVDRAEAIGAELRTLLDELEAPRVSALQAMAQLYGFDWRDNGAYDEEEEPCVAVHERAVIVQLGYGLGIGPGVPAYLEEQGAKVEEEKWNSDVHVSLLFRAPQGLDPRLDEELAAFGAQVALPDRLVNEIEAPWIGAHRRRRYMRGRISFFRDAGTAGLFFPIDAHDFVTLRAWLAERGIDKPLVALEEYGDQDLFVALAAARCTACGGPVEYLDPRLHDIETPQLVCKPCGGLYDLAAFFPESA